MELGTVSLRPRALISASVIYYMRALGPSSLLTLWFAGSMLDGSLSDCYWCDFYAYSIYIFVNCPFSVDLFCRTDCPSDFVIDGMCMSSTSFDRGGLGYLHAYDSSSQLEFIQMVAFIILFTDSVLRCIVFQMDMNFQVRLFWFLGLDFYSHPLYGDGFSVFYGHLLCT